MGGKRGERASKGEVREGGGRGEVREKGEREGSHELRMVMRRLCVCPFTKRGESREREGGRSELEEGGRDVKLVKCRGVD